MQYIYYYKNTILKQESKSVIIIIMYGYLVCLLAISYGLYRIKDNLFLISLIFKIHFLPGLSDNYQLSKVSNILANQMMIFGVGQTENLKLSFKN